jgi:hypothetical protein
MFNRRLHGCLQGVGCYVEATIAELAKYNSGIESRRFIPVLITPYLTHLIDIRQELLMA